MQLLSSDTDGYTVKLTKEEIGTLHIVGLEAMDGAYSLSDEEWNIVIPVDRKRAGEVFDQLGDLTKN